MTMKDETTVKELRKQVDECEERVKAAYELGYKESKLGVIKDTAKEIFQKLYSMRDKDQVIRIEMHNLQELCEGYGVEVE